MRRLLLENVTILITTLRIFKVQIFTLNFNIESYIWKYSHILPTGKCFLYFRRKTRSIKDCFLWRVIHIIYFEWLLHWCHWDVRFMTQGPIYLYLNFCLSFTRSVTFHILFCTGRTTNSPLSCGVPKGFTLSKLILNRKELQQCFPNILSPQILTPKLSYLFWLKG